MTVIDHARFDGLAQRAAGTSDEQVLGELRAFLAANRDKTVAVTWRVVP